MMMHPRPLLLVACGLVIASGCSSDGSAECLESDAGQVCAERSDGSIQFTGTGLQPDSAVLIQHADSGTSVYEVDDDGAFESVGGGVVSIDVGAPFTFAITATDLDGQLIEGTIDLTT